MHPVGIAPYKHSTPPRGILHIHLSTVPAVVSTPEEVEWFQTAVAFLPVNIRHPVGRF